MRLFQWLKNTYGEGRRPVVRIPDGPPAPPVRRRCRFSGCVQGVGFRFEAKLLADQLGLVGWVQNQSDGTVIVEMEGGAAYIDEFLRAMRTVPRFDITDMQAEDLPLSGTETEFKALY